MDKLRKIFVAAMICLIVSTIAVYAYSSVIVNLTWTWQTTQSFKVFSDPQHLTELTQSSNLDLGTFNLTSTIGSRIFYFHNDGDQSLTIYPNASGTNFVATSFTPVSLTLSSQEDGLITMAFTISGSGSASVLFDLTP